MRLHLPKGLLAALLAACFALPAGATIETTPLTSLEVEGITLPTGTHNKVTTDNGDSITTLDAAAATFLSSTGTNSRFKVTDATSVASAGTLVIASAKVDGAASAESAGQLYLARWNSSSNTPISSALEITNNLIIGQSAVTNAIRLSDTSESGAYGTITISGDVSLAQNAEIGVDTTCGANSAFISGSIIGEGKTLSVVHSNGTGAGYLNLGTGIEGKTLALGVLSVADTNVTMNYGSATVGNLSVESGASLANAGSLTITGASTVSSGATLSNTGTLTNNGTLTISGAYSGNTITNTGTLTLADAAVVEVGRLTNTITETAPTNAEGTAISGRVIVNGDFTLASGGTVNTADNVRFTYNGFSYSGSLSEAKGNLAGTISGEYYRVVANDEVIYSVATTEANISHIEVLGTLTGVKDDSITTPIPITGNGSVAVDGVLEDHVADLDQFTGTISLTGTSTDNLAAIKFGNNNTHLTRVSKIQLNANSYISGSSDLNFNYNLEFNGGFLLANQGSWVGAKHLLSDSSIQVHRSTNITGAFTAEAGKVLSIQPTTFSDGEANSVLTFSGTVGKLDGATLKIEDGATVAVTGNSGGNAQIAGEIVVNAGGTLKLTGADTLGYSTGNGNYTDSITMTGTEGKVSNLTLTASQTLSTNLVLNGYTSVSGSSVNSFGGSITVSGKDNVFSTELKVRNAITINVQGESDTLELSGSVNKYINSNGQSEGEGTITKTGSGTLIVSGANNGYPRAIAVSDGTLELRSAFNPVKIDLRGTAGTENTPATYGSLKIAAGGSAQLDTTAANGLWMYKNSSLILEKKDGDKSGGALSIGSYITIQADADDASIRTTATSGNGNYTFGGTDYEFVNANVSITSMETYKAKLTKVNLINSSTGNATVTVENSENTLRGVEAKGGNIKFAANAEVTGDIKIASGKSVIVNPGAVLTHDGFTYDGSTIQTTSAAGALSLFNNAVITGGTLTQKRNHNDTTERFKKIQSSLTNVELVNTSGLELRLESEASLSAVNIGGKLQVGANTTVSGASTVSGTLEVLAGKSLQMSGKNSTIATLTGSGALKASGDTKVTNASGFSGSLESGAGATLNIEGGFGVKELAALKSDGGAIWAKTGDASVTSVSISEVVLAGGMVGVYSAQNVEATVQTGSLTVSGSSMLYADLELTQGGTLTLNSSLTMGSTLTLNSGITLSGSLLTGWADHSQALTLFTGVDSLTLVSGATATTAEVGKTYDASSVFANEGMGNYKLQMVGTDRNYTVQMVKNAPTPEPTTATLSLLALMGLAARRRRKA